LPIRNCGSPAREQVQKADGYFFLVGDLSRTTFWEEVLGSIVQQLLPIQEGKFYQLETLLADLANRMDLEKTARDAATGQVVPTRDDLNAFITGLRRIDPAISMLCQDTARALVLLASSRQDQWEVGSCFLSCDELDTEERRAWGIRSLRRHPKQLIAELSRLLALSGPSLLAVDQIDALIDQVHRASEGATADRHLVAEVASGLMAIRDSTYRTLTVIACLPDTWMYVKDNAVSTVRDRFRMARQLQNIPSGDIGQLMIEKRFAVDFASVGFRPRYPTWPIRPAAFEGARRYIQRANCSSVSRLTCAGACETRPFASWTSSAKMAASSVRRCSADSPRSAATISPRWTLGSLSCVTAPTCRRHSIRRPRIWRSLRCCGPGWRPG
jgi:hypothetical protein